MPHTPKYSGADLREIRAKNGVGRLEAKRAAGLRRIALLRDPERNPLTAKLNEWGSQRAAARSLGMNLSTFQRRLAKETAP